MGCVDCHSDLGSSWQPTAAGAGDCVLPAIAGLAAPIQQYIIEIQQIGF